MELLGPSSVRPGIAGRLRRALSMDLCASPSPPPEAPGVRVFRASRYWEFNVCGAMAAGVGGTVLFTVVGVVLLWQSEGWEGRLWGGAMVLFAVAAVWALLAGNAGAAFPYAVEIEEAKGFRFYAPFKRFDVPTQEVKRVKWSWLWAGWVVRLRKRRGLLPGFIIHVAWGRQGTELAQAIREELARRS
jgi:hypothetical protein